MNVKTIVLNGDLNEEIYMANPNGLFVQDKRRKRVDLLNYFMV